MRKDKDNIQSDPYNAGLIEASVFSKQLLFDLLNKQSLNLSSKPLNKQNTGVYQRLAEVEDELAKAKVFKQSLEKSRAYRAMLTLLRLFGRIK